MSGVVLGVRVALSRAAEQRRRRSGASLGLRRRETTVAGLLRMAREQTAVAIVSLAQAEHGEIGPSVHEARKAIKRLRTILRLLEADIGGKRCARQQARLHRAAALLAEVRDSEVLLGTFDAICREQKPLARRKGVRRMRKLLVRERDRERKRLRRGSSIAAALAELRAVEREVVAWQPPREGAARSAAEHRGLAEIYGKGRRRARKARRASKRKRTRAMHEWRKRVKDLRYAAEALGAEDEGASAGLRSRRQRRHDERLAKLAARADRLGEALGEEHDLAVLQAWVAERARKSGAGAGSRRALSRAIARRRKRLRRTVLREGRKLYEPSPAALSERLIRR